MLSVDEAVRLVLETVHRLPEKTAPLDAAWGHVLAADAVAPFDLPAFPNSAVDGFAVRADDLSAASAATPVTLPVAEEIQAGALPSAVLEHGTCVRMMTGAPLPSGATAVVMKEDITVTAAGEIQFREPAREGENVRPQGQDIGRGDIAVPGGASIRSSEIAMLAAIGQRDVRVFPRPRLALFTTGDEVISVGDSLRPGQIYDSNRHMLQALCAENQFEVGYFRHLYDDRDETIEALSYAAAHHSVIVSSGGVSMGEHDHVRASLEKLGEIIFWRVAMKPGKPLVFGRIHDCLYFGLPGNPVSSMVSFELFVRPALRKMAGHSQLQRPRVRARLLEVVPHQAGREEYARVHTSWTGDEFVARPHPGQGSHLVSSMVSANSLAVIPAEAGSLAAGSRVDVVMTGWSEE